MKVPALILLVAMADQPPALIEYVVAYDGPGSNKSSSLSSSRDWSESRQFNAEDQVTDFEN